MRNVSDKFVEKFETHILCSIFFIRKSCRLCDNVENIVDRGRSQVTIWRVHLVCWINKATDANSEYALLIAFPLNNGCTNAPKFHALLPVPVLFSF
jgi:hypothetical protein